MLKAILHKSFTLVLAVAIFFSATGITVFKMVCSKSNSYSASLSQFDDCCKKNKCNACTVNDNCCGFLKSTVSSVQQYVHEVTFGLDLVVTEVIDFLIPFSVANESNPLAFCANAPPDIAGRDILIMVSRFII
ncbi:MAG: hypothetical protein IPJ79_19575 [Bacteroidetes bacterium]|nr:hypothetical protein [Bacteroidota bacterium]